MGTLFVSTLAKVQAKIREEGSIRSFAQRLDLNPTTISRWFAEQRSPDFELLCVILEHFGAKIIFPGEDETDGPTEASEGSDQPRAEDKAFSQGLRSAKKEIARLTQQLEVVRTERDVARGQAQALKEQLERLVPTDESQGRKDPPQAPEKAVAVLSSSSSRTG